MKEAANRGKGKMLLISAGMEIMLIICITAANLNPTRIEAEDYMYIDCLWVSGQFKGHGYSNLLLDACIKDSKEKGKKGACNLDSVGRHEDMPEGFVLYYTNQCPFTAKYVPILEEMAKARNAVFQSVHIQIREDAQNAPSPFTTFSLFYDGQFITHEILLEKKFDKILADKGV